MKKFLSVALLAACFVTVGLEAQAGVFGKKKKKK